MCTALEYVYKIIFDCSRTLSIYMDMNKNDGTSKTKKNLKFSTKRIGIEVVIMKKTV